MPSWGRRPPHIDGYDPDTFHGQYQQAREAAGTGDENAILAQMRRQHPDRYTDGVHPRTGPADVRGLEQSRHHVLAGDTKKNGKRTGGHLYETVTTEMREGQIAFPQDWDGDRIMAAAQQVIERPEVTTHISGSRYNLTAKVDDVSVTVSLRIPKSGPVVVSVYPNSGSGVMRVHSGTMVEVS